MDRVLVDHVSRSFEMLERTVADRSA